MLDNYEYENLLIGNLVTLTSMGYGPQNIEEGPYIFYKKNGEKNRYVEVFTEEEHMLNSKPSASTGGRNYKISKNEGNVYGKTYVKPIDKIQNYLNEEETAKLNAEINKVKELRKEGQEAKVNFVISKKRLLEIYSTMLKKQTIKREEEEKQLEKLEQKYVLKHNQSK